MSDTFKYSMARLPIEVARWATDEIGRRASRGFEEVSNYRAQRATLHVLCRKEASPCERGSEEWVDVCPLDGRKYLLGFDYSRKEPSKSEFFAAFTTYEPKWQQAAERAWKSFRAGRLSAEQKDSWSCVSREVAAWAEGVIRTYIEAGGYYHATDTRIGKARSKRSMKRFRRERSCCGCEEWVQTCPLDGERYVLGFNYGH